MLLVTIPVHCLMFIKVHKGGTTGTTNICCLFGAPYSLFHTPSNIACMSAGFSARSRDSKVGGRRGEAPGISGPRVQQADTRRHVLTVHTATGRDQVKICSNCLEHNHENLARNKCEESVITILLAISTHCNWCVDCRTADVALWLNCACL